MCSFVIGSDGEFFKGLNETEEWKFFYDATEYFASKYGRENVISAVVHKDETNPHLHLNLIPLSDNRLCAKDLKNENVIIILAESPHTSEFVFRKGSCVGFKSPLHKCDKKIKKYFKNNANNWFNKTLDYDIVIVNAIQYQCSFGLVLWGAPTNQKQRDSVFEWTWKNEPALADLLCRIGAIVQNKQNVILLNCCTAKLKKYCNSSIFLNNYGKQSFFVFDEKHPVKW